MRSRTAFALIAATVLLPVATLLPAPALADTEHCTTHDEFDRTHAGESPLQVANRFDVYGYFLSDSDNTFRRGYRTCWAPDERRIVIVYSYNSNESVDWFTREID